jgi:hypothetical protein
MYKRNAYRFSVEKPEGKRAQGRSRCRQMYGEIGWGGMD